MSVMGRGERRRPLFRFARRWCAAREVGEFLSLPPAARGLPRSASPLLRRSTSAQNRSAGERGGLVRPLEASGRDKERGKRGAGRERPRRSRACIPRAGPPGLTPAPTPPGWHQQSITSSPGRTDWPRAGGRCGGARFDGEKRAPGRTRPIGRSHCLPSRGSTSGGRHEARCPPWCQGPIPKSIRGRGLGEKARLCGVRMCAARRSACVRVGFAAPTPTCPPSPLPCRVRL